MKENTDYDTLTSTITRIIQEEKPQTVKLLVALVRKKLQLSEKKILDALLTLEKQGKIQMISPINTVPPKPEPYMRTKKVSWYWVTLTIIISELIIPNFPNLGLGEYANHVRIIATA